MNRAQGAEMSDLRCSPSSRHADGLILPELVDQLPVIVEQSPHR
jgi:hypothetical protein